MNDEHARIMKTVLSCGWYIVYESDLEWDVLQPLVDDGLMEPSYSQMQDVIALRLTSKGKSVCAALNL